MFSLAAAHQRKTMQRSQDDVENTHRILVKRVTPHLIGRRRPIRTKDACERLVASGRRIGRHGASAHPVNTRQFGLRALRGMWGGEGIFGHLTRLLLLWRCIRFLCFTSRTHAGGTWFGDDKTTVRIGMSTTVLECHGRTVAQSMIQPVEASHIEHVLNR